MARTLLVMRAVRHSSASVGIVAAGLGKRWRRGGWRDGCYRVPAATVWWPSVELAVSSALWASGARTGSEAPVAVPTLGDLVRLARAQPPPRWRRSSSAAAWAAAS